MSNEINKISRRRRRSFFFPRLSPIAYSAFGASYCRSAALVLLRVIRLDGLRLDNDGRVAMGQRPALGGDRAGDIARGQPQSHRDGGGGSHCQVLDGADEALFLLVG